MRTLNKEGKFLFLNEISQSNWARRLVYHMFHSDYDNKIESVVYLCRESTKALLPQFEEVNIRDRLNGAILHTIRLILTNKNKFVPKRDVKHNIRFFTDVMRTSFNEEDHQTAHMLWLALTHPAITLKKLSTTKRNSALLKKIELFYGKPIYTNYIRYWKTVHTNQPLPSLIAFDTFIKRREFLGKYHEAKEAREMLQMYKYVKYEQCPLLPIYKQTPMTHRQQKYFAKYLQK